MTNFFTRSTQIAKILKNIIYFKRLIFLLLKTGAVSADIPFMAKALVRRIKNDKRINFKKDWKMVTICMGGNDICSFICLMQDPETLPEKHRQRMIKALRYIRDNMPR